MKKLIEILTKLTEEKEFAAFQKDPDAYLKKHKLDKASSELLLSGELNDLRAFLHNDAKSFGQPPNGPTIANEIFSISFLKRISDPSIVGERTGSLRVVGTGIDITQVSEQTVQEIKAADHVFYCLADPISEAWLRKANKNCESLHELYSMEKPRIQTYHEMVEAILKKVREGKRVVAAFYGHPGVFAFPSHESVRKATVEGFSAKMLPAVSALDCLFADLGIDPARDGCQMFEATDFLVRNRNLDTSSQVILWQVGFTGELGMSPGNKGYGVLCQRLKEIYGESHRVILYEASEHRLYPPRIDYVDIGELLEHPVSGFTTMVIPVAKSLKIDESMIEKLGLILDS